jgi:hypothetical protein
MGMCRLDVIVRYENKDHCQGTLTPTLSQRERANIYSRALPAASAFKRSRSAILANG